MTSRIALRIALRITLRVALTLLLAAPAVAAAPARGRTRATTRPPASLALYFRRVGLDDDALLSIARGDAVAKLLPSSMDRDVFVLGVVAVHVSRADYLSHALDEGRLIGADAHRFHVIGDPPSGADVQDAVFDDSEYRDLRKCRPGNCNFKLSAPAMRSFTDSVDWSAPNAKEQADALLRRGLLTLVDDYRAHGDSALPTYADNGSVPAADAFAALVGETQDLYQFPPELQRYLRDYPSGKPANTRDVIYWSEQHFPHLRPTLTVDQVVVYTPPTGAAFVARKQLYASHYFDAAFELLAAVPSVDDSTTFLVTVRRFRFDALPRGLFNIRGRVRSRLVDAMRADLKRERAAAEKAGG